MDTEKRIAQMVLDAVKIYESSFDNDAAANARIDHEQEFGTPLGVDYKQFYGVTLEEAVNKAGNKSGFDLRMNKPVYLLIRSSLCDTLKWANEILNEG